MNTASLNTFQRLAHHTLRSPLGQSSDSVRLGFERGFDSGEMMDRIYQNRPSGRGGLGWLADAIYLNQIGCRGLRGRKALLKATLRDWIARQRQNGLKPVILDIASGPATYLVETLAEIAPDDVAAIGRDLDEHGLRRGEALARSSGVQALRFERGNALDEGGLRAVQPRPTLIIASGFYEILLDDEAVRASMRIVRRVLPPHGVFIFTTQVNHPQVEIMAALPNRDGQPWLIKNRSAAQVEGWAREAGFRRIVTALEATGLFSVSVAQ
jgi:SAM-dependent methyltransferase